MILFPEHPTHEEVTRKAAMTLLPTCIEAPIGNVSSPPPPRDLREGADG